MRRLLLMLGIAQSLASCGAVRFQSAWSQHEASASAGGIAGRWQGRWRSEWNGHSGGLRCVLTAEEGGDYRAWFFSTYAGLLFFQYQMRLAVTGEEADTLRFEGEQDLGAAVGGVYRYAGTIVAGEFRATYRADNGDHGVFELQRVE